MGFDYARPIKEVFKGITIFAVIAVVGYFVFRNTDFNQSSPKSPPTTPTNYSGSSFYMEGT